MIKKLQKLKAKKGFTLVELIVVIAIIGVLAAILIPTMLGYVTSSRVTSANSTAASIQKEVNNWLTSMDSKGVGAKKVATAQTLYLKFAKDAAGGADADKSCKESGTLAGLYIAASWNVKASVCADGTALTTNFETYLGDLLPDASGSAAVVIINGKCVGAVWTADTEDGTDAAFGADDVAAILADMAAGTTTFAGWGTDGKGTNGISVDGSIYGTIPVFENAVA